ncbi:MAG: maltose alpha-D-glucosyltransferase [Candidatus Handelsmanbacteria bacterium RIFCSPLOWO2_12_FULL_64_10]|uniref:Maltokinase n=1 Tax=Handelsmanbacteria sp. (strain RIFCSPLOWO2_12_FULL_64_10) TaxID=1817868 RepID=A0A1F6CF82_HANXR|nr:MAG: maltose alpha-D-glucosyltransferase [Candidatus Handelsmanbacteria bacterium RIFCSPLOWO2_12_FULL_64_10]
MTSDGEALWYQDAVIYEVPVRAFFDSNEDGIGDLPGLTEKLDYIQDLGITAIWLLPFYPSPLKDDGYDIADYRSVHSAYGTLQDFRHLIREAHERGLKVITELVINHTSDQHPWFQRARRAPPGSRWRQFYVWSDRPDRFPEARIIFKDFEASNWAWDPVARSYYWHRFYSHQPDLNFRSPDVRRAVLSTMDFWLKLGVDGLRLDAVPYLYEEEGTSCENLPETHLFLREMRQHMDRRFHDRMLLAEANQWPDEAAAYFGAGDECHMAFHFPVMPRLFMALRTEDRFPIVDILRQTPPIPDPCQWALFLRNHDELTLEMVTDEDRDYMYRVYAQDPDARINLGIRRRLAPLLGNHERRIELMNALLLSLPGTPVVYYGDEIGMGDNVYLGDRNGVRTPMQWSADRNAGFSRANSQRVYLPAIVDPEYHYEAVNVEAQQSNPHSLLWWMKRLIALRKRYPAFGRGSLEMLSPDNPHVLAFLRTLGEEQILVVANLSRFAQVVNLDLKPWAGMVPVELFSRSGFPAIGDAPYLLTLAPHTFFWFRLEGARVEQPVASLTDRPLPTLVVPGEWTDLVDTQPRARLEALLPAYVSGRRWFAGKAKAIQAATIADVIPIENDAEEPSGLILIVRVEYLDGEPDAYILPVTLAKDDEARRILAETPQIAIARLDWRSASKGSGSGLLIDAMWDEAFCHLLLQTIVGRRRIRGEKGQLTGIRTRALLDMYGRHDGTLTPGVGRAEQSNTSVVFANRMILKIFRRSGEGINPEVEVERFLVERGGFSRVPAVGGYLEYRHGRVESTIGVLEGYIENQGDAWELTLEALTQYFEQALAKPDQASPVVPTGRLVDLANQDLPADAYAAVGPYLESARLLGQRTAEMHQALASGADDPAFAPEPFTPFHQRSLYQSLRQLTIQSMQLLRRRLPTLPEEEQSVAQGLLGAEEQVLERFRFLLGPALAVSRMRHHGDFHLGQVLYSGGDFCFIDFEGEPARSLGDRRLKRSALRDVAGMLRSFDYASRQGLIRGLERALRPGDVQRLVPWARYWRRWVGVAYLRGYLAAAGAPFIPGSRDDLHHLLDAALLEKALYELNYEMNNRPDWVGVPLRGIAELVGLPEPAAATDSTAVPPREGTKTR